MFQVVQKIKAYRVTLTKWSNNEFNKRKWEIAQVRSKLGFILAQPLMEESIAKKSSLMQRLDALLSDEESFWCQRSRIQLVKEGDWNTKFFHQRACIRKAKNHISDLRDELGRWRESEAEIEAIDYFSDMFKSSGPGNTTDVLDSLESRVSAEMGV